MIRAEETVKTPVKTPTETPVKDPSKINVPEPKIKPKPQA